MALRQRLEMRQGQSLVMTPQLQQAIKLLQLSNIELAEYVEQELERNPLLERDETRARAAEAERETVEGRIRREPKRSIRRSGARRFLQGRRPGCLARRYVRRRRSHAGAASQTIHR